jgi:hypothetical protein
MFNFLQRLEYKKNKKKIKKKNTKKNSLDKQKKEVPKLLLPDKSNVILLLLLTLS